MQDNIAEIKKRINIFDICAKAGRSIERVDSKHKWIRSIYRDETNASLSIDFDGERYYDWGNQEHGDVIDFYMDLYGLDKSTAIKELMSLCGIDGAAVSITRPLPTRTASKPADNTLLDCLSTEEKALYQNEREIDTALARVQKYRMARNREIYEEFGNYCSRPENRNESAFKYLREVRKLPADAIEKAFLFSFHNYSKVNNHLKKEFDLDQLQRSGLYNKKCKSCSRPLDTWVLQCECGGREFEGNLIFYCHRIIIPYIHEYVKIIYLRARYFDESGSWKTDQSKYIGLKNDLTNVNTAKRFYGLDILKKMFPGERLFILEGEFDSIMMNSRLIGYNSIAIPGSGNIPPRNKFLLLKNFDIHVIPDHDAAGSKLIDGKYYDKNGLERTSHDNLTEIFGEMNKEFTVYELREKDLTDFVIKELQQD